MDTARVARSVRAVLRPHGGLVAAEGGCVTAEFANGAWIEVSHDGDLYRVLGYVDGGEDPYLTDGRIRFFEMLKAVRDIARRVA